MRMKKNTKIRIQKFFLILILLIVGCYLLDDDAKSEVFLTANHKYVGRIVFKDTPQGLHVKARLKNLPVGLHGFHIHEKPSCEAGEDAKGVIKAALKAGGHYDPNKTEQHLGPDGKGHKGDLPVLRVEKDGTAHIDFYNKNLSAKEVREKSVVIHEHGDNYKDTPEPLGGGGARIACGVIR